MSARIEPRVFLATGEEVFITQVCTKCRRARPLRSFGLRRMADRKIRSIPQCKVCRSGDGSGPKRSPAPVRRGASEAAVESARRQLAAHGIVL